MYPLALQRAGSLPPGLLNHRRAICRRLSGWATAIFGRLPEHHSFHELPSSTASPWHQHPPSTFSLALWVQGYVLLTRL